MFRPRFTTSIHSIQYKELWSRLLPPLALWICVSVSLRYGYYGSSQIMLGPTSSRLTKVSPVFVKRIEVKEEAKRGIFIYGFDQRPELSLEANWNVSKYLIIGSYNHHGFFLWLNKGSRIRVRWEAPSTSLDNLQISIIKGEQNFQTLLPNSSAYISSRKQIGCEEADYGISEDDKYYVSIVNTNPRSIIMTINVNVSSKMYDTANASSVCSTLNGSCKLNLLFPNTRFVVLTTPNNADLAGWYIELSFVSRIVTYVAILGIVLIIIFLILKYLGVYNDEHDVEESGTTTHDIFVPTRVEQRESDPLMTEKAVKLTYGTVGDDPEAGSSSSSSDELYDGKICVICYDEPRNCFFVPCGHCATCYDCAERIMEGESRACPICRRLIHKVRKLFTS